MINGIGVVGWGVGGIEAEAGMLGQPVYFLTPDVVGVNLNGQAARRRAPRPTSCSPSPRCCARRRWSASSSSSSAKAPRRSRARPRDHRQHGAGVRRDDGLLPGRRQDHRVLPRHRPHRRRDRRASRPTSRRRACSACRRPARSTTPKSSSSTSAPSRRRSPARSGRRTASNRQRQEPRSTTLFSKPVAENGFAQEAGETWQARRTRRPTASTSATATC